MNLEKIILTASVEELDGKKTIEMAKKKGFAVDNPTLGFFSSVLCEIERPNKNKIRLAEQGTYEAIDSIIGCQVNFNHIRRGAICGYVFDAFINKANQVVILCGFFKGVYKPEYEYAKKLFAKKELTMSYELTADVETQDSLPDGTRRIHDFYFTGAGLLLDEEPACSNAIVHEFAKKLEDERQELIFASKRNLNKVSSNKKNEITTILASLVSRLNLENETNQEGGDSIVKIEEIKAQLSEELGEEIVKDWTDEDFQNEEKIAQARKEKEEAQKMTIETEVKEKVTETINDENKTDTITSEYEIIVKRDGEVIRTEKSNNEIVYMASQVDEIKAEYEKQIEELKATLEVKNSEIAEVRENAETIAKLKFEYANNEFTKEFNDEDWLNAEKLEEAKQLQVKKEKIEANKEALKDNEFAKDFTDEDFANDDKVNSAKLQAELQIKEAKIKELEEKANEIETEDEEAEKEEDLETNHTEDEIATEKKSVNIVAEILKEKRKK